MDSGSTNWNGNNWWVGRYHRWVTKKRVGIKVSASDMLNQSYRSVFWPVISERLDIRIWSSVERIKPEIKDWEVARKDISSHSTHESDLLENELRDWRSLAFMGHREKIWGIVKLFFHHPPQVLKPNLNVTEHIEKPQSITYKTINFPPQLFFMLVILIHVSFKRMEILKCDILARKTVVYVYNGTCTLRKWKCSLFLDTIH